MTESKFSPVPRKQQSIGSPDGMSFAKAIEAVAKGRKITKLEWDNSQIYGVLHDNLLCLHKDDGKLYHWVLSDGDLLGDDWVLLTNDLQ